MDCEPSEILGAAARAMYIHAPSDELFEQKRESFDLLDDFGLKGVRWPKERPIEKRRTATLMFF